MEKKRGDPETVDKKGREGALKMESGRLELLAEWSLSTPVDRGSIDGAGNYKAN